MSNFGEIFVIDTSSLIAVRESIPRKDRRGVFEALTGLVEADTLVFPVQVHGELAGAMDKKADDQILAWSRRVHAHASCVTVDYEIVKEVLAKTPRLIDPDKPAPEQADPYVVALAVQLNRGGARSLVVTDDRKEYPKKTSVMVACGRFRVPSLPLLGFLEERSIWLPHA